MQDRYFQNKKASTCNSKFPHVLIVLLLLGYRFEYLQRRHKRLNQLSKNFSLMPDVQLVFDPANNPGESSIGLVRFRRFA
jgi:hypothetical protein